MNNRNIQAKFTYSDIIKNLASIFLCGGTAIEDANVFRNETFSRNPSYSFCSPDTILKSFAKLQKNDTKIESVVGQERIRSADNLTNQEVLIPLRMCTFHMGAARTAVVAATLYAASVRQGHAVTA